MRRLSAFVLQTPSGNGYTPSRNGVAAGLQADFYNKPRVAIEQKIAAFSANPCNVTLSKRIIFESQRQYTSVKTLQFVVSGQLIAEIFRRLIL